MKYKLVIFDFDGTIADTRTVILTAKKETMRRMGYAVASDEEFASTIGFSSKVGFHKLYPELSEETLVECETIYRQLFEEMKNTISPTFFTNVDTVLEELTKRGIQCTIATSRDTESVNEFLTQWKFKEYFKYILGNDNSTLLKPNPQQVLKTLKELSFSSEESLVVGDMPVDIEMGRSAGVCTCGVTYGNSSKEDLEKAGADYVVEDIIELMDIVSA